MNDRTTPKEEFARLINRLTDRILPDTSERSDNPHPRVGYGVTFLGALTWAPFMWLFAIANQPTTDDGTPIFTEYFNFFGPFLFLFIIVFVVLFSVLIGASVRRGTPLNFYLWGLMIPVLVTNILKFTF